MELVVLIGIPATGKSSFARERFAETHTVCSTPSACIAGSRAPPTAFPASLRAMRRALLRATPNSSPSPSVAAVCASGGAFGVWASSDLTHAGEASAGAWTA